MSSRSPENDNLDEEVQGEDTFLLPTPEFERELRQRRSNRHEALLWFCLLGGLISQGLYHHWKHDNQPRHILPSDLPDKDTNSDKILNLDLEGMASPREPQPHQKHPYKKGKKSQIKALDDDDFGQDQQGDEPLDSDSADFGIENDVINALNSSLWQIPEPEKRCDFVMDRFAERDHGVPEDELKERYKVQSTSPNVFYRATAVSSFFASWMVSTQTSVLIGHGVLG